MGSVDGGLSRWRPLGVVACVLALSAGCGSAAVVVVHDGAGGASGAGGAGGAGPAVTGVGSCPVPKSSPVSGPAGVAFTGGPVSAPFTLDGGALTVDPPPSGERPAISMVDAECTDLASSESIGNPVANPGSGLSVGYGLVSVRQSLVTAAAASMNSVRELGVVAPKIAAPTPFQDRLAWVVVNTEQDMTSCPAMTIPAVTTTTVPRPRSYYYGILVLDAKTGVDPLIYYESTPQACGGSGVDPPTVGIPVSDWSVPWTLVSRDPHGYSGTIRAQVLPCDGYSPTANVERGSDEVVVSVLRPIGATCGSAIPVDLTLQADTVFDSLPADIVHAPTGPYLDAGFQSSSPPTTGSSPPLTNPPIINLGPQSSGTTIHAKVGAVIAIMDLVPGVASPGADRAISSNPDVVGLLGSGEIPEFRAWTTGEAILTIPKQSCQSGSPPCTSPWVVHVDVG